jgi:hypothetical protein
MRTLAFNQKRLIVGVALAAALFSVANYYLDLGVFGRFGKHMIAASFVVLFLSMRYAGPTITEVREYREQQRRLGR